MQGIAPRVGYDPADTYSAPVLGSLIWGDLLFRGQAVPADAGLGNSSMSLSDPLGGSRATTTASNTQNADALIKENLSSVSHYCTILSHRVTKIINVPVFADNIYAGLGGALYNVTIPDVDNWRRLVGQPRYGVTAIPEMFSDPQLGGKVVLNITDGLSPRSRAARPSSRSMPGNTPPFTPAGTPWRSIRSCCASSKAGACRRSFPRSRRPPTTSRPPGKWGWAITRPRKSTCTTSATER